MPQGMVPQMLTLDVVGLNAATSAYVKCKHTLPTWEASLWPLQGMLRQLLTQDVVSWIAAISAGVKVGQRLLVVS